MKVAYRGNFLKSLHKLKDVRLKKAILSAIDNVEQADSISEIRNLKKLTGYESHSVYFAAFGHRKGIYDVFR